MSMIQWAYGNFAEARFNPVASVLISGGPKWINTERFQIDAKSERAQKSGTMNGPMLRELLEERFHLVIRREVKEVSVYSLTISKGSVPKMTQSNGKCITIDPEDRFRSSLSSRFLLSVAWRATTTRATTHLA